MQFHVARWHRGSIIILSICFYVFDQKLAYTLDQKLYTNLL